MCGINGYIGKNEGIMMAMNKALHHRGPDFAGDFFDEDISLGHTLLSIREVSNLSIQPYSKENSDWILIFNGQIYNTKSIKKELDDSYDNIELDTALIYGLILKYGWNFIDYIHGMFAIALYNKKDKVVKLYRDQSGQKPLYYYVKDNNFIFSSELKSILLNNINKDIDEDGLIIATGLGYIPGTKTIFKHIKKLSPGNIISYSIKDRSLKSEYISKKPNNYFSDDWSVAFEELVQEHLQSKQEVAINLSGGLDSSLLLHEMAKNQNTIHSYTTKFENSHEKFNRDAVLAKQLANDYNTTHHEINVTKRSYLNHLIRALEIVEEPDFNISLPVYLETAEVEGMYGDKKRVIISGSGGDEIFGGYSHYFESLRMSNFEKILTPWGFSLLKNWRNKTSRNFHDMDDRWLFFRTFTFRPIKTVDEVLLPYIKNEMQNLSSLYKSDPNDVHKTMLRDRLIWMPGESFLQADKLYMSQSVEVRSPLSYHPFREYCDSKLKMNQYVSRSSNKLFLRELYRGKLPDYIINRTDKTGWRSPIVDWYDNDFKNLFLEILTPMKNNQSIINWNDVIKRVENTHKWPGKQIHLYLSLAVLSQKYKITL